MVTIWVERLLISERVAIKIREKHDLETNQVRQAVVQVEGLEFSWDFDPERGVRALVDVQIGDDHVLAVLYPTENPADHTWRLGSAYVV